MKVLAFLEDPKVVKGILMHLGLRAEPLPIEKIEEVETFLPPRTGVVPVGRGLVPRRADGKARLAMKPEINSRVAVFFRATTWPTSA